jgi:putative ABC transport system permease protein
MNRWTLSVRSLRHYWRTQVSVVVGIAVGAGVLIGALVVGDSVAYSLRRIALARVGQAQAAWVGEDRFFREEVAADLGAPVLMLDGSVALPDGTRRANAVQLLGVDTRFFALAPSGEGPPGWDGGDGVWLNRTLVRRLGVALGDAVVVRMAKPSALPTDAPLSSDEDQLVALRLPVAGVVEDEQYGRFSLRANQAPAPAAFMALPRLQQAVNLAGRANLMLFADAAAIYPRVRARWALADSELRLAPVPGQELVELRTDRVFLEPAAADAALAAVDPAYPVLSYFVNELSADGRFTPYSTVAAVSFETGSPWAGLVDGPPAADAIVLNEWVAEDLGAGPGDAVALRYYVMGPLRTLVETSATFRVHAVVPMQGVAADPSLMPDYPGFADADDCRDWEPGFAVDLDRIRDRDEAYWDAYRGTPKAFIPLATGRHLWQNRFGDLTAIRFPPRPGLEEDLNRAIEPAALGHAVVPLRDQALQASSEAMSFSGLFVGFSMFLIAAALLLTGMLFVFGIEQRVREIGTLRAVGYTRRQVHGLLWREGSLLAVVGSLAGIGLGIGYTRLMLHGLGGVWQSAIGETTLWFHARPGSLATGFLVSVGLGLGVMAWTVRRLVRRPPTELLKGELRPDGVGVRGQARVARWVAGIGGAAAGWVVVQTVAADGGNPAEGFFSAGMLILVAVLAGCRMWLVSLSRRPTPGAAFSAAHWTGRNLTRRPGRSLATVALLACGTFMVAAAGVHRQSAARDADRSASGTGGFVFVGEATQPITRDLNLASAQAFFGLEPGVMDAVRILPIRVRQGDDASCLNLNRAQQPTLAGVPAEALSGRFTAAAVAKEFQGEDDPWALLKQRPEDGAIPAIADLNSILWAMGKQVGDTLAYTDEQGNPLTIRLVAGLANSMVQGMVLIDADRFVEAFPSTSGFQRMWIEAPADTAETVADELSFALQDYGLDLERAVDRLDAFNAVQNTYLSIFQVLGGMGLLLGSVGLGIVVLRNILERRAELALLRGLGFTRAGLQRLLISEHNRLLAAGLGAGILSAAVAVVPTLLSPGSSFPFQYVGLLITAVAVYGYLCVAAAATIALRGDLLPALREE